MIIKKCVSEVKFQKFYGQSVAPHAQRERKKNVYQYTEDVHHLLERKSFFFFFLFSLRKVL